MLRILPLLCAFLLLIASGISHRLWTGAWSVTDEPGRSAARLAEVRKEIGEWVGADVEVNARELKQAEAVGYLARRYVHRTGTAVDIFIICGRPGPIAVHTPDICYVGAGFEMAGSPSLYQVDGDAEAIPAEFMRANLDKTNRVTPEHLRIYWAWKAGRGWKAPANPRLTFGGAPALYKLYITCGAAPGANLPERDPCQDFMNDLLPELEKALSPAS